MTSSQGRWEISVAQDGSGRFRTVQEAIDAVPLSNNRRVVIRIGPGVYSQPIYVPKTKNLITLTGTDPNRTTLSWHNTATSIQHHQAPSVIGTGTFACGSVIVEGEDFIAENLAFENAAPQGSGQAVAIRVTADRCSFYSCRFLGWQDTAYLHYGKQYFRDCYIEGSVDFIFGNATVLLEHCHIHCKSQGFITAQQRKSADESTGYVFLRCVITGNGDSKSYMHLGRPWGPHARVVFAYTHMDSCILPSGWNNWNNTANEKTASYSEYRCSGPGSDLRKRVPWLTRLSDVEASQFLTTLFIDPRRSWIHARDLHSTSPSFPVPLSA
ncbi:pectinesterase [Marchantia polymorpha subsp. ruderalis]|uniref:Pectinesterase n=2 Tax=Marchantia polymorpha TaxID=3197 RepID=A0AAF6AJV9_MARPO|nr:hypothetical protein MARPO_0103s0067 [Marchantia polymorpha]BBM96729.1 hypothetical protein Mp_1g00190 [Marchantia polymorpha subsp. ruderalis]|eukprot:PTQ32099.1 hypothetical protein MARPO_0103s0067 [Marchantia polymorpha]